MPKLALAYRGTCESVRKFLTDNGLACLWQANQDYLEKEPWLLWLNGLSSSLQTKGTQVDFPVRAHAWVVGQIPSRGHV